MAFGGRGEFDGVMTGPFRRPRVEGDFIGADLWAWDTLWGDGTAHIVVENEYVDVKNSVDAPRGLGDSRRRHCSRSATRARTAARKSTRGSASSRRDLTGLRHAFQIDEYPVSGLLSGEFHLTGAYQRPMGFGGMTIDNGVRLRRVAATRWRRRCGSTDRGIRLDGINIDKSGGDHHRRGVRRLGLHLLVQRRRPPDSRGSSRAARGSPRRRCRAWPSSRPRATGRSTCRATTSRSA